MSSLSSFGKRNIEGQDKGKKNYEIFKVEKIPAYRTQEKWIGISPKKLDYMSVSSVFVLSCWGLKFV